MHYLQ